MPRSAPLKAGVLGSGVNAEQSKGLDDSRGKAQGLFLKILADFKSQVSCSFSKHHQNW